MKTNSPCKTRADKPFLFILIAATVCFVSSCSSERGDYTAPFFHSYKSETDNGNFELYLSRWIEEANEYHAEPRNIYSGIIIDRTNDKGAMTISGDVAQGAKKLLLTYPEGHYDTVNFLSVTISGDGSLLEGWHGLRIRAQEKNLPDSIPFKAIAAVPTGITFKLHAVQAQKKLFPDVAGSPYFEYDITVLEPLANNTDSVIFKKIKKGIYDIYHIKDTVSNPIEAIVQPEINDWLKRFKDDKPEDYQGEDVYTPFYIITRSIKPVHISDNILSLALYNHNYSGGAHSLYSSHYHNFNLRTGEKIRLRDVLNSTGYRKISGMITAKIRKQKGLSPGQALTDAYYNNRSVSYTDNFYLTDYGIGFHYNVYEIASFASGETRVFIPFSELEGCLKPSISDLVNNTSGNQ